MQPHKLFRIYYIATPLFLLLEIMMATKLRAMIPDDYGNLYYLYYALCFVLGGFVFTRGLAALFFAVIESGINLFILFASVMIPVFNIASDPANVSFRFGVPQLINFLLVGSILIYGLQSVLHVMRESK